MDIYIYTLTGRRITHQTIPAGQPGAQSGYNDAVRWNGRDIFGRRVGNGAYIAHLLSGQTVLGKLKILVIR